MREVVNAHFHDIWGETWKAYAHETIVIIKFDLGFHIRLDEKGEYLDKDNTR